MSTIASTRKIFGLLAAVSIATSAVSVGTIASASAEHGQDDAAQSVGLAFGTLEAPREITVTMTDSLRFDPGTIVVAQGETIRFLLDNPTAAAHDFTLGDAEAQEHHAEEMAAGMGDGHDEASSDADASSEGGLPDAVSLQPGETTEVVATFNEAGELLVGCHVPGHWEAGMRAAVQVVNLSEIAAGTEATPREIPIAMTDELRFDPELIVVTAGETVRFMLNNPTAASHDFTIGNTEAQEHHDEAMAAGMGHDDEAASEGPLPDAVSLAPGESVEVLATFDETGQQELLIGCHVPGHWEAGMRGQIVVLPALV